MQTLVDDVGSFPLPSHIERKSFEEAYRLARAWTVEGRDFAENKFLYKNFYEVVTVSFRMKLAAGLDVVNYPQHYDIYEQFTEPLRKAMEKGTYMVDEKDAIIPEIYVINQEAKKICEEFSLERIILRTCITGPFELYLKEIGTVPYQDVLLMFAETVRRFAKNSLLNSRRVQTEVVSIDEPSFGFREVSADKDTIMKVLEKAFDFSSAIKQIHLHSPSRITDLLEVKNIDVVSIEYAASPKNLEFVSKSSLEKADKQIRVGISRTDIDTIMAELHEKGITKPQVWQIVEDEHTIKRRFEKAKERFGEKITFTGPDCGLGGWPNQEAAQLLLKRTVNAVKQLHR